MPQGNGAKAKQTRERKMKEAAAKAGGKSQLKVNEQAKTIVCKVCRQSFMGNSSRQDLEQHATNKHSKQTYNECFDVLQQ